MTLKTAHEGLVEINWLRRSKDGKRKWAKRKLCSKDRKQKALGMFKKTCWGVKSKERIRFRKLEQLMKALAINSQNVDPVHRYRTTKGFQEKTRHGVMSPPIAGA